MKPVFYRHAALLKCIPALVVTAILSCTYEPLAPAPNLPPAALELQIADLKAESVGDSAILLTWSPPSGSFDFFRIFRTAITDTTGRPDSTTLLSTELRRNVNRGATSFLDVPELNEGVYYYAIRAVKIDGIDTVEGGLNWATAPCTVGSLVKIIINNGDLFTASNIVEIELSNPRSKLQSERFTQLVRNFTRLANGTLVPVVLDTNVAGIARDPDSQIIDLKRVGWWLGKTDTTAKNTVSIPQFDTPDDSNPSASVTGVAGSFKKTWKLLPRLGQKTVYAEVLFKPGVSGVGIRDTIFDQISTMPHKIDIVFRNSIDFSIKNNADSTLAIPFDCWLMFSDNQLAANGQFKGTATFVEAPPTGVPPQRWAITPPMHYALTGKGPNHQPDHLYHFSNCTAV